ncbi:hypothetical protein [Macrococcus carouselicus]|uniref:Uncharacterized protein n=2 Tax=Staphylococcaceae TaxID=90964 RepID=A0A9Q8CJX8_9STAP|nr:hypothetical protein [Macrococcus carouselicus]TDM00832.1 hypothetical protein ERX40_08470 [Macrococcus carouselicus]
MIKQIIEYIIDKNGDKNMIGRNFLSTQDEDMLSKVYKTFSKINNTKIVYSMVKENAKELLEYIGKLNDQEQSEVNYQSNRYLLNYLAMARLFIDRVEENIAENYTKNSVEYINFKKLTSNEYDSSFTYRLLWDLRNYTQHYALPIHKYKQFIDEEEKHHSKIYICPDILINGSFKWKLVVLKDLKQQTKDLDVLNLIEEHMISLSKIYKYFLLCYIDQFKEAINKYEIFRNEYGYTGILYLVEFKDYKTYKKADIRNYKNAKLLGHEKLIDDYISELDNHGLFNF